MGKDEIHERLESASNCFMVLLRRGLPSESKCRLVLRQARAAMDAGGGSDGLITGAQLKLLVQVLAEERRHDEAHDRDQGQ